MNREIAFIEIGELVLWRALGDQALVVQELGQPMNAPDMGR